MSNKLAYSSHPLPRLDFLDGFRALTALYVVMHHASHYFGLQADLSRPYYLLYMVSSKGHYAVDMFIVISGFCLSLPVVRNNGIMREGFRTFIAKRARRILPPYYLTILFSLLVAMVFWLDGKQGSSSHSVAQLSRLDFLTHLLLVQDALPATAHTINHVLWSISVEWRIYFLFPLLVWAARRYGVGNAVLLAAAISLLAFLALRSTSLNLAITGINPHYLLLFSLGTLAAQLAYSSAPRLEALRQALPWRVLCLALGALLLVADWRTEWEPLELRLLGTNYVVLDLLVGLTSATLLLVLSTGGFAPLYRFFAFKPLSFVGTFAYSIYLIHAPLQELLYTYAVQPLGLAPLPGFLLLTLVGSLVIVVASYLFFLAAEKPFMNKKTAVPVPHLVKTVSVLEYTTP